MFSFFVFFFWGSCFHLVLYGQVRGNLGKFGGNLGKNGAWSALIWKNVPNMKRNAVVCFGGHFLWRIFRASLEEFGQKSFAPPKICLLLTYARGVPDVMSYLWNNWPRLFNEIFNNLFTHHRKPIKFYNKSTLLSFCSANVWHKWNLNFFKTVPPPFKMIKFLW